MNGLFALLHSVSIQLAPRAPAFAGQPPDPESIVVTGASLSREKALKVARAHGEAVPGAPVSGHNAR